MNFSYKPILFVVCLIGLIALQAKVIMPTVYDVVSSDLFLEDNEDTPELDAKPDEMLSFAFDQCNNFIANDLDSEISATFSSQPINAWSLESDHFVVNADIDLTPSNAQSFTRRYVCRIKYTSGTDLNEITNSENWSIEGVSGLDNL